MCSLRAPTADHLLPAIHIRNTVAGVLNEDSFETI